MEVGGVIVGLFVLAVVAVIGLGPWIVLGRRLYRRRR